MVWRLNFEQFFGYFHRPTLFGLSLTFPSLPLVTKLGSPSFRGFLVKFLPFSSIQKLRQMVDVLHTSSINILEGKKSALRNGDENLLAQVGRGKDLMSILCVYPSNFLSNLGTHSRHSEKEYGSGRPGQTSGLRAA
jgi:hypothetical protein